MMIKGAQKQLIVVRTGDSRFFEEAYFVLKRELPAFRRGDDLLQEANRILQDAMPTERKQKFRLRLPFWAGFLCGCLLGAGLLFLLFRL